MKFLPYYFGSRPFCFINYGVDLVPTIGGLFRSGGNLPVVVPHPSGPDKSPLHERISAFGKFYKIVLEKALNNPGKVLLAAVLC